VKVQCSGCRTTLSVPDEKIPEGKTIRVLCPKCKKPIQVSRNGEDEHERGIQNEVSKQEQPSAPTSPPVSPTPPPSSEFSATKPPAGGVDIQAVDMVEEGVEKALLCLSDSSVLQSIESTLHQMDYYISTVSSPQHVIIKLSNNPYDVVVIDEALEENKEENEESLFQYIHSLPMHTRRTFLLCLISREEKTLDHLTAFRLGFNLILNVQDQEKTKLILERAIRDYKNLYRTFTSELKKKE
jgi:hypothetical protein